MNFAEPFIRRPVATTLLVITILIFGIIGYRLLPVSDLPSVDYPTIQVSANLPGASPETMASSVATPLEKQFSTIAGVTSISSSNGQGNTNITLQFDLSRDIDSAAQDVQSMIARAARSLPPGMPSPPSYQKVNPADQPILFLTLSSATLPMSLVNHYAEIGAGAAPVDGQRRRRRQRLRRPEVRGPHRRRPDAARVAPDRHRPGRAGDRRRERESADRHALRAQAQLRRADQRPVDERRRVPADSRRLPQRQPGASQRSRQRLRRRREPAQRQLVQRHADDLPRHLSASPAPTPCRSSTRSRRCCRSCRSSCRRRSSSASAATVRSRSASRSTTSSSRCC